MLLAPLFKHRPPIDPNEPRWKYSILGFLAVVLFLAILAFVYTGTFSRFQADDYCSSQLLRTEGFWGAQVKSYTSWSNRFSTMLVTGLVDLFNVIGIRILPGVLILGLLASAFFLFRRVLTFLGIKINWLILFSVAGIITFFSLYTTPNQFQSYYWRSGNITYTLPVICLNIVLGLLIARLEQKGAWWQYLLIGLFGFFAAGFSETNAALQAAALTLGMLGILWYQRQTGESIPVRGRWIAALAGTLLSLAVIALSPGNAVRQAQLPDPPGFFTWLYLSFRYGLGFAYNSIAGYVLPVAVSLVLSFALAIQHRWEKVPQRKLILTLPLILITVYLLLVACCAPSAYAQSAYPEDRAMTGAKFILMAGITAIGFILGILFQSWRSKRPKFEIKPHQANGAFVMVMISFYIFFGAIRIMADIPDYMKRAAAWDTRAAQIAVMRQAGDLNPVVTALDSFGRIRELSDNPDLWVNRCAATYYQVDTITAK